jgi:excisionase family DNA binding protein
MSHDEAARQLGMSRRALYRLIEKYHLDEKKTGTG